MAEKLFSKEFSSLLFFWWTQRRQICRACRKFLNKKPDLFCSKSLKGCLLRISHKIFSLKLLLWTSGIEFWQPCTDYSYKIWFCFEHCPKMKKAWNLSNKIAASECFYGYLESSFNNLAEFFLLEGGEFCVQGSKLLKNVEISW